MLAEIDKTRVPRHVAIVMDGNGRWANNQRKPRLYGHKVGAESVRVIVEDACDLGIEVLTLYAFSSENWKRPEDEVSGLMSILQNFLISELKKMQKNNIRLNCIGDYQKLPPKVRKTLVDTIEQTVNNTRLTLNLALSYGARDEITRAIQNIAQSCVDGRLEVDAINHQTVSDNLYTAGLPDPDLLIRTGGESRLSNFLLWQASYAEIYFTPIMWPEFRTEQFYKAIADFQHRERRFGKTSKQLKGGTG